MKMNIKKIEYIFIPIENTQTKMSITTIPFPDMDYADMVKEHDYITTRLFNIVKFTAQLDLMEAQLNLVKSQLDYERTDNYKLKSGVKKIKCNKCNNSFIGGSDYHEHLTDSTCEKSRTCKNCTGVFSNMMAKSRHKKNCL